MAIGNSTGDGKGEPALDQMFGCSANLTGEIHDHLKFFSVLSIFLSISAFLGNSLILVCLHKVSSLHQPTKLLLRCLATTDLFVGLISGALAVIYWTSAMKERWNICRYVFVSGLIIGYALCGVSLLTVTAMSVDKLLALSLGLRYRQVVTLKRTLFVVVLFWVICIVFSATFVENYLTAVRTSYVVITLCLVTSVFCYTKIFLALRRHQTQVQDSVHQEQPGRTIPMNVVRYRKAVSSALWLQFTIIVCYLPHGVVSALSTHSGLSPTVSLVRQFTVALVFLNSTLNPILYCCKLREVRQAVKETFEQILFSPSSSV